MLRLIDDNMYGIIVGGYKCGCHEPQDKSAIYDVTLMDDVADRNSCIKKCCGATQKERQLSHQKGITWELSVFECPTCHSKNVQIDHGSC